ncbi:DUF2281 domain-containing protein [bacterium]|nr:DUF2281 domain-containing protein [bacterium]
MKISERQIEEALKKLPDEAREKVWRYINFLLKKYERCHRRGKLVFDWEGGLSDIGEEIDAVELQHKALEWR